MIQIYLWLFLYPYIILILAIVWMNLKDFKTLFFLVKSTVDFFSRSFSFSRSMCGDNELHFEKFETSDYSDCPSKNFLFINYANYKIWNYLVRKTNKI